MRRRARRRAPRGARGDAGAPGAGGAVGLGWHGGGGGGHGGLALSWWTREVDPQDPPGLIGARTTRVPATAADPSRLMSPSRAWVTGGAEPADPGHDG